MNTPLGCAQGTGLLLDLGGSALRCGAGRPSRGSMQVGSRRRACTGSVGDAHHASPLHAQSSQGNTYLVCIAWYALAGCKQSQQGTKKKNSAQPQTGNTRTACAASGGREGRARVEALDQLHDGALAAARRPHQRHHLRAATSRHTARVGCFSGPPGSDDEPPQRRAVPQHARVVGPAPWTAATHACHARLACPPGCRHRRRDCPACRCRTNARPTTQTWGTLRTPRMRPRARTSPGLICSDTPLRTRSVGRAGYEKSAQRRRRWRSMSRMSATPACSLCMPGDCAMANARPRRQNCHTLAPHFTKLMCHCTSVESATAGPGPYCMLSETAGASAAAAHMARPCCCAQAEAARAHRHRAARRAR